ncbi:hypothetical protein DPMN_076262 [Dreissena polymorpha]|uniref:UBX domain-containing protein 4 n=1 Tax=Dreissena polymorpha TaxID=45954 RepID=A0A9D3YIG0_DREPO|nr:hypothetical protein DPMN_076262 [Dreissena polymorpha]
MKWFTGGIPQAIKVAKDRGTLFVVYIYGSDEMSLEMNQSWENDEVTVALSDVVAIRIDGSTEDSKHFSQIYPIVVIPATYCIGENGVPLEVIGGALKPEELITRIKKVQEMHAAQKLSLSGGATNSSSTRQVTSANQDTVQGESPGPSAMQEEQGAAGDPSTSAPLEEKQARAKELIERKRIEKEQQEFEKAREEEIKRRKLGQDLLKLKSTQQEIQMKELKDQMKKEKDDEKKARERVKQQIAKDREDRAKKFDAEKQEREKQLEDKKKEKLLQQQAEAAAEEARKSETARIQVRLPDGSSLTHTFPSTDTFRCLYSLVAEVSPYTHTFPSTDTFRCLYSLVAEVSPYTHIPVH